MSINVSNGSKDSCYPTLSINLLLNKNTIHTINLMINYFIFIYSFLIIFNVHDTKVSGKSHLLFCWIKPLTSVKQALGDYRVSK